MSTHPTRSRFITNFFHVFGVWLLLNIQIVKIGAELQTQTKYLANNFNYFAKHNYSYKEPELLSLEIKPNTAPPENHVKAKVNEDLLHKLSWKCANNGTCLYNLLNDLYKSYRHGDIIKLGLFDLVKLPPSARSTKATSGRSMSTVINFFNGNAIRVPIGPMVFSVQRAAHDADYIEVALLKKVTDAQARFGGNEGGSGGGGGGGQFRKNRRGKGDDKKEMQMFIPMYLAATTFGWTVLAFKAVSVMVLKALTLSKIAFVVASLVLFKKMMDSTSEKLMYQYNEPSPYMMPYGMDYSMHSGMSAAPVELGASGNDLYSPGVPYHATGAVASPLLGSGLTHPGLEHLTAESQIHQTSTPNVQNNTQMVTASFNGGLNHILRRTGNNFLGRRGFGDFLNYTTFPLNFTPNYRMINLNINRRIAAAAAAEVVVNRYESDSDEEDEEDDDDEDEDDIV